MVTVAVIFLFIALSTQGSFGDSVQVEVENGVLAGETVTAVTNITYYSFKGIPYAKPPLGKLRFMVPQEPDSWEGVRNATEHGSVCPQVQDFVNQYTSGSEDCLYINVYTPTLTPDDLLPVIVVIHGGAFHFLSGNVAYFGPDFFMSKKVILVTFNYRLHSLGFMSMGTEEVPGNAGLKDQVLALNWVQKNIKSFGGNASCVTIMGESAGAASVGLHLLSPKSKGLFHRAIASSGAPTCDLTFAYQAERRAFALGSLVGLNTKNKTELLEYLQSIDYEKIVNISFADTAILASQEKTEYVFRQLPFLPVIENASTNSFIDQDPLTILETGDVNEVDVLFSYNTQETIIHMDNFVAKILPDHKKYPEIFVPDRIRVNSTPNMNLQLGDKIKQFYFGNETVNLTNIANFVNYANNVSIVYDVQRFFRRWSRLQNSSTYFFKFASYYSRNYYGMMGADYNITGASHFDDQIYTFDPKVLSLPLDTDSIEYGIIEIMTTAITNFAKTGNPTVYSSIEWPEYNESTKACMSIDANMTLTYAPDEKDYQFFKSIFEIAGVPF